MKRSLFTILGIMILYLHGLAQDFDRAKPDQYFDALEANNRFQNTWKAEPETDISIPLGAGGIVSTAADLTRFSDALFGGRLFGSQSLDMMKTIRDQFRMGLFQIPFYDRTGYGHTGGTDGFSPVVAFFPAVIIDSETDCRKNNLTLLLPDNRLA